ncbi:MAG: TRAP transporter substrate-binding protein [Deltaproteobacteria bacterium]|nr:TRAP transporter substrate-binding protein [Deltaproteobacteria bacterium]
MKLLKACLMSAVAAIAFGTGIACAAPDVVTLKVAHFLPASSTFHQKNLIPWCDKINKESGGRLKCQLYPSMQLGGSPAQLFDQVRDGVADIVWTVPTYQAGRFTKSEVFELPFIVRSAEKGSMAIWDYIHKNAMDEFKGTKLIFTHVHDGSQMHFGSKPVKTLEDLKGLKVRAPTRIGSKTLAALGAVPVQMPAPAVPESIAKGVVDGASLPWEVTTSFKLQEICKSHNEVAPHHAKHSNAIFAFAMNQAKYNGLPPELKKVIDQNSGIETSRWVGKIWDDGALVSRKIAVDRRNNINVLSDAEYKRWVKATEGVDDEWIKEVAAKGGNGKALLNDAKAFLKKYND